MLGICLWNIFKAEKELVLFISVSKPMLRAILLPFVWVLTVGDAAHESEVLTKAEKQ